ncbi:MAG: winged helix-turn-helix domain-containing protein, partial [Anaerolineae bacterium]|nr:winged helix-turn-helix domain-containing protein [Anaerolineae bacterium]
LLTSWTIFGPILQVACGTAKLPKQALIDQVTALVHSALADYLAEETGIRVSDETVRRHLAVHGIVLSRPQHKISSPDPEYEVKKRRLRKSEIS